MVNLLATQAVLCSLVCRMTIADFIILKVLEGSI